MALPQAASRQVLTSTPSPPASASSLVDLTWLSLDAPSLQLGSSSSPEHIHVGHDSALESPAALRSETTVEDPTLDLSASGMYELLGFPAPTPRRVADETGTSSYAEEASSTTPDRRDRPPSGPVLPVEPAPLPTVKPLEVRKLSATYGHRQSHSHEGHVSPREPPPPQARPRSNTVAAANPVVISPPVRTPHSLRAFPGFRSTPARSSAAPSRGGLFSQYLSSPARTPGSIIRRPRAGDPSSPRRNSAEESRYEVSEMGSWQNEVAVELMRLSFNNPSFAGGARQEERRKRSPPRILDAAKSESSRSRTPPASTRPSPESSVKRAPPAYTPQTNFPSNGGVLPKRTSAASSMPTVRLVSGSTVPKDDSASGPLFAEQRTEDSVQDEARSSPVRESTPARSDDHVAETEDTASFSFLNPRAAPLPNDALRPPSPSPSPPPADERRPRPTSTVSLTSLLVPRPAIAPPPRDEFLQAYAPHATHGNIRKSLRNASVREENHMASSPKHVNTADKEAKLYRKLFVWGWLCWGLWWYASIRPIEPVLTSLQARKWQRFSQISSALSAFAIAIAVSLGLVFGLS